MTLDREYTEPGGVCDCGLRSFSHEQTTILKFLRKGQKQLGLQSAQDLMLNNGLEAVARRLRSANESATQFNREYSRFFGQPPMGDVRCLRSLGVAATESI
jgi:hypothetical protein